MLSTEYNGKPIHRGEYMGYSSSDAASYYRCPVCKKIWCSWDEFNGQVKTIDRKRGLYECPKCHSIVYTSK